MHEDGINRSVRTTMFPSYSVMLTSRRHGAIGINLHTRLATNQRIHQLHPELDSIHCTICIFGST